MFIGPVVWKNDFHNPKFIAFGEWMDELEILDPFVEKNSRQNSATGSKFPIADEPILTED